MARYNEDFPVGSQVRTADYKTLEHFLQTWEFHNKLQPEQLACAGKIFEVLWVGYYHGGDVLYTLKDAPGVWHEQCLSRAP